RGTLRLPGIAPTNPQSSYTFRLPQSVRSVLRPATNHPGSYAQIRHQTANGLCIPRETRPGRSSQTRPNNPPHSREQMESRVDRSESRSSSLRRIRPTCLYLEGAQSIPAGGGESREDSQAERRPRILGKLADHPRTLRGVRECRRERSVLLQRSAT